MDSYKQLKAAQKNALAQRDTVRELNAIVRDVERCEKTIVGLQRELGEINTRFQGPRNTREDIEYLTALLACAKKKLVWEKHLASLQKRTPATLAELGRLLNDPAAPPDESTRNQMLAALQSVQVAMERLQNVAPSA
jgi:hypothetical protein